MKYEIKQEEPWCDSNEKYMKKLVHLCRTKIDQHERSGYHYKKKYTQWGLPSTLLPTIMAPISVLIDEYPEVSKYINAVAFITTSIIVGVSSFYRFNEQMANHFNIASRYSDIASDIDLELIKGRKFRIQIDVFLMKTHMIMDSLSNNEPIIPAFIVNDIKYKSFEKTHNDVLLDINTE